MMYASAYTRLRYQVSVYRTIGPPVFSSVSVAGWSPFEGCILSICNIIYFSVLVLRAGFGFWLFRFLVFAYFLLLFTI